MSQKLQAGRIYVLDRGYAKYSLFQDILQAQSSFICRIRDNAIWQEMQDNPLSEKAVAADVVFDKTVILGGENATVKLSPIRLIGVKCTPNTKQHHTGRGGPEQGEILWIATDLFDLETETIATIYKRRWTVEIFFRFFKAAVICSAIIRTETPDAA